MVFVMCLNNEQGWGYLKYTYPWVSPVVVE